jgi:hypothetical protein
MYRGGETELRRAEGGGCGEEPGVFNAVLVPSSSECPSGEGEGPEPASLRFLVEAVVTLGA